MFAHRCRAEQVPANDLQIEVKDKHQRCSRGQWHARPEAQSQRNEYLDGYMDKKRSLLHLITDDTPLGMLNWFAVLA